MSKHHCCHITLFLIFLIQAIIQFILSSSKYYIPVTKTTPHGIPWNASTVYSWEVSFDIYIMYLVASFMLITSIFHVMYIFTPTSIIYIVRWIEYSITSTIMIVSISSMSGISDINALLSICGCNITMIMCGLISDISTGNTPMYIFILGSFIGFFPWLCIFATLITSQIVPPIVIAINVSIFTSFFSFGVHQLLIIYIRQLKPKQREKYMQKYLDSSEYIYTILSLVSKTALSWQVFGGLLI